MKNQHKFDVALSFASEDEQPVEGLANLLKRGGHSYFYAKHEEAMLWGRNLHEHLSVVYKDQARYCVMFLSQHYARKLWPKLERESAQARAFEENREYILPIRLDDTEIPGILPTTGYLDLRSKSIKDIYLILLEKMSDTYQVIGKWRDGKWKKNVMLYKKDNRIFMAQDLSKEEEEQIQLLRDILPSNTDIDMMPVIDEMEKCSLPSHLPGILAFEGTQDKMDESQWTAYGIKDRIGRHDNKYVVNREDGNLYFYTNCEFGPCDFDRVMRKVI